DGLNMFFNTVDYRTPHIHPEWEIIWVVKNALVVNCSTESFVLEPSEMIVFNPNEPHEFHKMDKPATFLCLQISPTILPEILAMHIDGRLVHEHISEEEFGRIKEDMSGCMLYYLERKENFSLYCVGKACLLLYELLQKLPSHVLSAEETDSMDKRNTRLKRLIRFVDENYMHKIRLTDFAQMENCSVSYLSRFIKSTLNQNFQDYVTSVRFNCACKLIAQGGMRLLDVCVASGFSDYRYFSKEFQKQYHMTPEEYRNHIKSEKPERSVIRHSLHSVERFYSREDSLKLVKQLKK
ncbi:MAG: helix-turn-helix transcriptional regulator, partial [Agathobacter sp.]|nr:helix-turn-helix transcriptional regulator [Agathobacter sp.]